MNDGLPNNPTIIQAGDSALTIRYSDQYTQENHERLLLLLEALFHSRPPEVLDIVLGHTEILVVFDPSTPSVATIERWLQDTASTHRSQRSLTDEGLIRVPVCFDLPYGLDLKEVATRIGMSPASLISTFTNATYRCTVVGFRPGFPYLDGLPEELAVPRRPTPRAKVALGSVAIAGSQAGIYPVAGPGGWNVLGRTPIPLFDHDRANPCLVTPGTRVQFYPIDPSVFSQSASDAFEELDRSQR
jgi:inhibitor of KinA